MRLPRTAAPRGPSRRTVLRGSAMAGAGIVVVAAASGCDRGPDANVTTAQTLVPLMRSAVADAATARTLGPRLTEYSAALGVVADERAAHAQALREEITRLDRDVADTLNTSTEASASATPAAPVAPTLDELRTALRASAKSARASAIALSGYSAGLAGSISAASTTLVEVQLA